MKLRTLKVIFIQKIIFRKYELDIDINSKPLKNKLIEINTTLKFQNKKQQKKNLILKLFIVQIVKIDDEVKEKKNYRK